MAVVRNIVNRTADTTATTGTGTLTLSGAAPTGIGPGPFNVASDVLSDGDTVEYIIYGTDAGGDAYECGYGTYTASGTTLARTAVTDTDDGGTSALNFTAITGILIAPNAESFAASMLPTEAISTQSANVNATVNQITSWTMAGEGADRDFVLPGSANVTVGDRVGIHIADGDATHVVNVKTNASGDTIWNRDCSSTSWRKLYTAGDYAVFRVVVDGGAGAVDWVVDVDSVRPPECLAKGDGGGAQSIVASTYTSVKGSGGSGPLEATSDRYGWYNATNGRITPTIKGEYLFYAAAVCKNVGDGERMIIYLDQNWTAGGGDFLVGRVSSSGANQFIGGNGATVYEMNGSTDWVNLVVWTNDSASPEISDGSGDCYFGCILLRETG